MSAKGLDALVMRAVQDCDFRNLLESKPEYAFAGFDLSCEEKSAIKRVSATLNAKDLPPVSMGRWY